MLTAPESTLTLNRRRTYATGTFARDRVDRRLRARLRRRFADLNTRAPGRPDQSGDRSAHRLGNRRTALDDSGLSVRLSSRQPTNHLGAAVVRRGGRRALRL